MMNWTQSNNPFGVGPGAPTPKLEENQHPEPPKNNSFLEETVEQTLRVIRYSTAVARWEMSGRPERTKEEILHIFENICKPCDYYVPKGEMGQCRKCGCALGGSGGGLTNKIAMATESCPLNPPKWAAKENPDEE